MVPLILNCDLGEDEPLEQTARLVALVGAASICCGVHAGSLEKTRASIALAHEAGVWIGAHPGLPGQGGRGAVWPSVQEFLHLLETQLASFQTCARSLGASTSYLKLHGTLYHAVEADPDLATAYIEFLRQQSPLLAVFARAGGPFAKAAESVGLRVIHEAFADRAYLKDGSLLPRSEANAVLNASAALERFKKWIEQGSMPAGSGRGFPLRADTLCVHSDSPDAIHLLELLRSFK